MISTQQILLDRPMVFRPNMLKGLEAWYDSLDPITMLAGDGNIVTDGGTVALWKDKSGNSGVNALVLPGVALNYASAPDSAAVDIAGDFSLWATLSCSDWTPAASSVIASKYTTTGNQRSFFLQLVTDGRLEVVVSSDGTSGALTALASNASVAATPFSELSVRADYSTSGTARFYTSTDGGVSWTELGTVRSGTARSPYVGTAPLNVSGHTGGTTAPLMANVKRVVLIDGTYAAGTTVLDIDFTTAPTKLANGDTFVCTTGQTVTLNSSGATGARIAGGRDLFQGTAANRPVLLKYAGTKYGYLNGNAGNYFSTPDSAAVSVTGDVDLIALVTFNAFAAAGLIAKDSVLAAGRSYQLSSDTSGYLTFGKSADGSTVEGATATVLISTFATLGAQIWVRSFYNSTTGDVKFYSSPDGATWTQRGSTISLTATPIADTGTVLSIGAFGGGSARPMSGRVLRGQVWSGDSTSGGTLVADFNPALYTSGTTFTASTGEVWTVNGGAHIVTRTGLYGNGSATAMQSAKYSSAQPLSTYVFGEQVSWTSGDYIIDGSAANAAAIVQTTSTPQINLNAGSSANANTGFAVKTFGMLRAVFNGASSLLGVNRVAPATGDAGATAANGLTVFASGGLANNGNAFIAGVAQYGAAQDAATSSRLALWGGRRHGFTP